MERHLEIELDLPITDEMDEQHKELVDNGLDSRRAWRQVAQNKLDGDVQSAVEQLS